MSNLMSAKEARALSDSRGARVVVEEKIREYECIIRGAAERGYTSVTLYLPPNAEASGILALMLKNAGYKITTITNEGSFIVSW